MLCVDFSYEDIKMSRLETYRKLVLSSLVVLFDLGEGLVVFLVLLVVFLTP